MKNKVISLAKCENDGTLQTPEQALKLALDDIGKTCAFENGKKLLIIALDDSGDKYDISFIQAGMQMSECNNLCDIAKVLFKKQMGY